MAEPQTVAAHATSGPSGAIEGDRQNLDSGVPHPYHLVKPSIWPLAGSLSGGLLAVGALRYLHHNEWAWLIAGFLAVLLTMALWWRDVIRESVVERVHTPVVKFGFRYGMALFIASEVMFFVAFFWAFFNAALYPTAAIDGVWPPPNIQPVEAFGLPFLMTMILLLSGCTVTWAHHAILEGHNDQAQQALGLTVLLGIVFTGLQAYEYAHAAFGFKEGIFPTTFYMATGFHGFHVIVGTLFLAVVWWRTARGHFTPKSHFGFEAAAWYWHFVDVVWLFLFTTVYWWGSHGAAAGGH